MPNPHLVPAKLDHLNGPALGPCSIKRQNTAPCAGRAHSIATAGVPQRTHHNYYDEIADGTADGRCLTLNRTRVGHDQAARERRQRGSRACLHCAEAHAITEYRRLGSSPFLALEYLENFLIELYRAPGQLLGLYVGMKQECRQPKLPGQVVGGIDFQLLRDERTVGGIWRVPGTFELAVKQETVYVRSRVIRTAPMLDRQRLLTSIHW